MRRLLSFGFSLLLLNTLQAQAPAWSWSSASSSAGWLNNNLVSIAATSDGSTYACGSFSGITTYGGITLNSTGTMDSEVLLVKHGPDGALIWARKAGSAMVSSEAATAVATDAAGNAFVCGNLSGNATTEFGGVSLPGNGPTSFAARYAPDGTVAWAVPVTAAATVTSIAIGPDGGVHVIGSDNTLTFFWKKLDPNSGALLDSFTLGGIGVNEKSQVVVASNGDVLLALNLYNTVDMDPGPGVTNVDAGATGNACVARYAADGTFLWEVHSTGTQNAINDIALAPDGAAWVPFASGFGGTLGTQTVAMGSYVARVDASGSVTNVNPTPITGTIPTVFNADHVAVGPSGDIYLLARTGFTSNGSVNFYIGADQIPSEQPLCVVRMSPDGTIQWAAFATASTTPGSAPVPGGLVVLADNDLVCAGRFDEEVEFGDQSWTNAGTGGNGHEYFVARLGESNVGVGDRPLPLNVLYPNPATDHLIVPNADATMVNYEITDLQGRSVVRGTTTGRIDLATLQPGAHVLHCAWLGRPTLFIKQ